MEWMEGNKLALCIRKGEVWYYDTKENRYELFASGLHEPLGLLKDGDLLVAQRTEITRLKDRNKDGIADAYLTESTGWSVSGSYHAYVYGPEVDSKGNKWVTLNLDMGEHANNATGWRDGAALLAKTESLSPWLAACVPHPVSVQI